MQLSAMLASAIGRIMRVSSPRLRLLVACGAAAGIASAYNAPVSGALFVAEVVMGTMSMGVFGPLVCSSVVATLTIRQFVGADPHHGEVAFHRPDARDQGAFMQATSDRFHSGEPISPIFAEIKLSISYGGSVHHHGRLPCPYPSGTYPFPPSRWPKSSSASARAYVHRLALLNQFGRNGSDSVKFLVARCAIHFSDEFVELRSK